MIDPRSVCLYIPDGLKDFKLHLFERIGQKITAAGGSVNRGQYQLLAKLPRDVLPVIGCSPELTEMIKEWRESGRPWIYWDRGYMRRVFATWLPRGSDGGYYRWHLNSFQQRFIDDGAKDDRFKSLQIEVTPWQKNSAGHIVVACLTHTYERFHGLHGWTDKTLRALARTETKRQIVVRDKESKRPLQDDLRGAYCLVTHGSNTAVEAVICGCPVIVHPDSAASLVGVTDLGKLDHLVYPDRTRWLNTLAYNQFNEFELVNGTLWRLLR